VKKKSNKKSDRANVAFGDALRRMRSNAGLTQEKLAEMAGIHRNHVGDIERGDKEICLLTMLRLCGALQIPLSRLALEMEHPAMDAKQDSQAKRL
jgi:transcriptional regulator with XRE-family HTH domain